MASVAGLLRELRLPASNEYGPEQVVEHFDDARAIRRGAPWHRTARGRRGGWQRRQRGGTQRGRSWFKLRRRFGANSGRGGIADHERRGWLDGASRFLREHGVEQRGDGE